MTERIKKCIEVLNYAIQHKISASSASLVLGKGKNYVSNFIEDLEKRYQSNMISKQEYLTFKRTYDKYKQKQQSPSIKRAALAANLIDNINQAIENSIEPLTPLVQEEPDSLVEETDEPLTIEELADIHYNAETDESYDERSVGESIKNEEGKITHYYYKVLVRDEPPLEGHFTRDEMNKVYRLYSNLDGAGLTLRAVSREFAHLTFRDFKRILRAFNITKQSIPVAPHILEEKSDEEVAKLIIKNKENNVLKKLEAEKSRYIEKNYLEAQKTIIDLKAEAEWVEKIVEKYIVKKDLDGEPQVQPTTFEPNSDNNSTNPTIGIFGDIHYGKKFDSPVYGRGYNKNIAHERVMSIADYVVKDHLLRNSTEIILICAGDLVESILEDGMHPGHHFEMDLFQEDQIFFAVDSLKQMLNSIKNAVKCKIQFHAIGGNHDRVGLSRDMDKNRTAHKIIATILKRELEDGQISFNIPKNNLAKIVTNRLCIFAQHGDSALSKKAAKRPSDLVNLYGEPGCYSVLLQGHWHSMKAEEGIKFTSIKIPSVTSTDKYCLEELGNNNLPGFILGHQPDNCDGFNYTKITLH